MITESVIERIERGRRGENVGLAMGLPKLEGVIDGVCRNTFTLLFGPTGGGKSSLALYAYIYKPFMENMDNPDFKIIYYSLELSAEDLLTKLLSIYLWEKYHRELPYKDLLSKQRGHRLSDDDFRLVQESRWWLDKLESVMTVYDRSLTADKMYAHLLTELGKHGRFEETETRKIYKPFNKQQLILVVIDHIGLLRQAKGRTKKQEIDLASDYLITLRNRCGISPLVLMQMNRDSTSMDRRSAGFAEPIIEDTKETNCVAESADIVIAIFNPQKVQLATYRDYRIRGCLEDTFRAIIVRKNRYGMNDVSIGNCFYGSVGIWKELPKGKEITDYTPYLTLDGNGDMKTHGDVTFKIKMD